MKDSQSDTNTTFQSAAAMLMLGELKSFMFDHITHLAKPWPKMSELEQDIFIDSMDKQARSLINQCVYEIAGRGTEAKRMVVRKAVADETQQPYKVALTAKSADDLLDMAGHIGTEILVILPQNVDEYLQGGEDIKPEPDQRPLDIDGSVAAAGGADDSNPASEAPLNEIAAPAALPSPPDDDNGAMVDADYEEIDPPAAPDNSYALDTLMAELGTTEALPEPIPKILNDPSEAATVADHQGQAEEMQRGTLQLIKAKNETGLLNDLLLFWLLALEITRPEKDQRARWLAYLSGEWSARFNPNQATA